MADKQSFEQNKGKLEQKQGITDNNASEYTTESELRQAKPAPVADPPDLEFNDLKKGQIKNGEFIVRNVGGPYKDLNLSIKGPDIFLKIINTEPLQSNQAERLPMKVYFEAYAADWSKRYNNTILIGLDDVEEEFKVELDTQTKPVNDFAGILRPQNIKIITALIDKLERNTSVEIAIITVDSLEGKTIERYANDLFNEWGIGKEGKNNGILFLICPEENKYRIEIGLGLEETITPDFIDRLFEQYGIPNFRLKRFGEGIIMIIKALSEKINREA